MKTILYGILLVGCWSVMVVESQGIQAKQRRSSDKSKVIHKSKNASKTLSSSSSSQTAGRNIRQQQPLPTNTTMKTTKATTKSMPKEPQLPKQHDQKHQDQQQQQNRIQEQAVLLEEQQQQQKLLQQKLQQQQQQQAAEAEAAAAAMEQIRLRREMEFETKLARMSAEQRALAQQQKKRDAKIVQQVLRASAKNNLYQVLGLRHNWERTIPAIPIRITKRWNITTLGPVTLFHIPSKQIKRAYRNRALQVHPDRNRDGRAEEATVAVVHAAEILLDDQLRQAYDQQLQHLRQARIDKVLFVVQQIWKKLLGAATRTIGTLRTLLGPFFVPMLIFGVLIV